MNVNCYHANNSQIALGMLKLHEEALLAADNSAQIFNILSTIPSKIDDVDVLLEAMRDAGSSVTDVIVEDNRRRQVSGVDINFKSLGSLF